jgi:hypothetical protein
LGIGVLSAGQTADFDGRPHGLYAGVAKPGNDAPKNNSERGWFPLMAKTTINSAQPQISRLPGANCRAGRNVRILPGRIHLWFNEGLIQQF